MITFIALALFLLQFTAVVHFCNANNISKQKGFKCTNVSSLSSSSNARGDYGCTITGNILRAFVIGDIGGEEYETVDSDGDTTAERRRQQSQKRTVEGGKVVKHRTTKTQIAVAKAMDSLAKDEFAPNFVLNLGDNFYERGVTFADVETRLKENFEDVYKDESLNVPWYTIAGNNDWKSEDGIRPQIEIPKGKWTFPAQHYVVHYQFENGVQARFIMIDTTVLCGSGSTIFAKTKKYPEKYAEMVANAKKHFSWLRKQLREAKRRRVNFLFIVGHCPLHIIDNEKGFRYYPCANRMKALMRHFQVQAYFAGHEHNLKYVDLKTHERGLDTKYIVSGAGSRMESAVKKPVAGPSMESAVKKPVAGSSMESAVKRPDAVSRMYYAIKQQERYSDYMKFLYPINTGEDVMVKGEKTRARGALDGGAFVGIEIDAKKMKGKLDFYAAGMLYDKKGEKRELKKWHKFEGQQVEIEPRIIDDADANDDICNEFVKLEAEMEDDEHFIKNDTERIQNELGKYFCKNLNKTEKNKHQKTDKTSEVENIWTEIDKGAKFEVYAEEALEGLRAKFGISYLKLAKSFLSDDLVELNSLGKSKSRFYRTMDEQFLLKSIPYKYEVDTIQETLQNYVNHLLKTGDESFLNRIFLVFRMIVEGEPMVFLLMNNVFDVGPNVPLLTFDVKGTFSRQRKIIQVEQGLQRLNDVVLKWYNFFGGKPTNVPETSLLPEKVEPMFKEGILLDQATHKTIAERLRRDFAVLSENNVNDWSIIIGVHFEGGEEKAKTSERAENSISVRKELPYFDATCNQCRNHPNSLEFLDGQKLRLYIGIVDIFTPFSEERKKRYIDSIKNYIKNVEGDDLMAYIKAGRSWETFGPLPPSMYTKRFLAFSMACAFRWQKNGQLDAPEAIRRGLISAFCDSYGNVKKEDETQEILQKVATNEDWMYKFAQRVYTVGPYTVTVFAVELFKLLMEKSGKFFWNFLNELAVDENRKFVVQKLDEADLKLYKPKIREDIIGWEKTDEDKPQECALLELKHSNGGMETKDFYVVTDYIIVM